MVVNTRSLQEFQKAARTTFKEVLTTGLRTCEDQSGVVDNGIIGASDTARVSSFQPKVWGTANFDVHTSWLIGGQKIAADQKCDELGGCVKIEAKYRGQSIPVKVEWSRAYRNCLFGDIDLPANSSTCPITADDAGCVIKATVTALRATTSMGAAFVEVGPFDMDVSMKQDIVKALDNKKAVFSVDLVTSNTRAGSDSHSLHVSPEALVLRDGAGVEVFEAKIESGSHLAVVDLVDCTMFSLRVEGDVTHRLMTISQRYRDTIVLTIRAFQALATCNFQLLMEQVVKNTHQTEPGAADSGGFKSSDIDLLIVLESLAMHALSATELAQLADRERNEARRDRDLLEKDMDAVISSYRELLSDAGSSSNHESTSTRAPPAPVESRQKNPYLIELEQQRVETLQLKQKLAEREKQLQMWMASPPVDTQPSPVSVDAREVARHLERLSCSTTLADEQQMLNTRTLEMDQLRVQLENVKSQLQETTQDRDFLTKKCRDLETQQTRLINNNSLKTTSANQRVDLLTQCSKREQETWTQKMNQLEAKLKAAQLEIKSGEQRERELRRDYDDLRRSVELRMGTFTAINRTGMDESTIRDMDTTNVATTVFPIDASIRPGAINSEETERLRAEVKNLKRLNDELTSANKNLLERVGSLEATKRDLTMKLQRAVQLTTTTS